MEFTVRQGHRTKTPVAQQEMEQSAVVVHHHVDHAVFVFKIVNVDDDRVVVGVEQQKLVVGSHVKDARF